MLIDSIITPPRFPKDTFRFLFWVFFTPFKLHRYIYNLDPSLILVYDPSLWVLWQKRKMQSEFRDIILLTFFSIFVTSLLSFLVTYIIQIAGFKVNWFAVRLSTALTFLIGLTICTSVGMSMGLIVVAVFGAIFSVAFGLEHLTVTITVLAILGVLIITGGSRFVFYVFEAPMAWLSARRYRKDILNDGLAVWDREVLWPHPRLINFLVQISFEDRQDGMEAIAFVASSFRLGWVAERALYEVTAIDVYNARSLQSISEIAKRLSWLPDDARTTMRDLLISLEQVSQHATAALKSKTPYNRQEQLRMGLKVVDRVRSGLIYAKNGARIIPALKTWKHVFEECLADANLEKNIPNVYVSGSPLIKESKVFKGRKDLFRTLENELLSPADQRPTIVMFGARRMGKTSTLKQFPIQVGPQIVPVSIDLQKASTVEGVAALLSLVSSEIVKSANLERHLKLPQIEKETLEKDPYLAFQDWLSSLDEKLGDYYWVLLALDEFESLGEMLDNGRVDERIFQMLRGVIQHHPRITVLMSGAHTLEELPPLWSNYFINTKMLKVGPLGKADAIELITRPIPDFPLQYDEDALELMLEETGCHPNWLQFTCREVVERLNDEDRFHALREDVEWAIARVPQVLAGDFKDMWEGRDSSDLMRAILKTVAKDNTFAKIRLTK